VRGSRGYCTRSAARMPPLEHKAFDGCSSVSRNPPALGRHARPRATPSPRGGSDRRQSVLRVVSRACGVSTPSRPRRGISGCGRPWRGAWPGPETRRSRWCGARAPPTRQPLPAAGILPPGTGPEDPVNRSKRPWRERDGVKYASFSPWTFHNRAPAPGATSRAPCGTRAGVAAHAGRVLRRRRTLFARFTLRALQAEE
jgi:hypothetical protein